MTGTITMDRRIDREPRIITAAPAVGADPHVYCDPYPGARGDDLVKMTCGKCGGDGLYHAPSGYVIQNPYGPRGDAIKGCFDCMGRGHRTIKVASVRARVRREVKAAIRRAAEAEQHAAAAAAHAAEEFASAWEQAHAEAARRAGLNNEPIGQPGERVKDLAGVVEVSTSIEVEGFRGGSEWKRLVVIKLDSGQVIKTFGSGAALFGTRRGDQVTVTGATVKGTSDYQGQLQTTVARLALRIDAPALRCDDIAAGDAVEYDGTWYPVLRADADGVTVQVQLGEREWTSVLRYHEITGHRREGDTT